MIIKIEKEGWGGIRGRGEGENKRNEGLEGKRENGREGGREGESRGRGKGKEKERKMGNLKIGKVKWGEGRRVRYPKNVKKFRKEKSF